MEEMLPPPFRLFETPPNVPPALLHRTKMVTPAPKKRQSKRFTQILALFAILLVATGSVWVFVSSLAGRTSTTASRSSLGAEVRQGVVDIPAEGSTTGDMHLSAKTMLASKMPYMLYGTAWKKDATASLVTQAIHAGFRFIDTACQPKHYNEKGVGQGVTTSLLQLGLDRTDIFLQTKFTSVSGQDENNIPYEKDASLEEQVKQSVHKSLDNLQTTYIDSLVLHSPMKTMDETLRVWRVFESFVDEGKVKQLGISNCYDMRTIRHLYAEATIKPAVLQNRFHKEKNFDIQVRSVCDSLGIKYQSFWTLTANRKALASPEWVETAKVKGLTPQTLMYAFMMTLGHTPLSGTTDANHMAEDVDIMLRFQNGEQILDGDEVKTLSKLLGLHG